MKYRPVNVDHASSQERQDRLALDWHHRHRLSGRHHLLHHQIPAQLNPVRIKPELSLGIMFHALTLLGAKQAHYPSLSS